jgi:peptide/nickel transport system permease protein
VKDLVRFAAWRLLLLVPIALGVSVLVFLMVKIAPGDPVASILGTHPTAGARAAVEHKYGLDKPTVVQYFYWLGNVAKGDLGESITQHVPAGGLVWRAMLNTCLLAAFAAFVAVGGGVLLGTSMAFSVNGIARRLASVVAVIALSVPQYTLSVLFIIIFAVKLEWLPTGGMRDPVTGGGVFEHLVLPGLACGLVPMGIIARVYSASLRETASSGWVESLRARGLSTRRLIGHITYGSISPLLTIAGLQVGYLLGGVVYAEAIFAYPGVGQLIYQSISKRDLPVIQAGVLVTALAFVLLNFIVDLLRAGLDPRVRAGRVVSQ